jgi:YggT family protein
VSNNTVDTIQQFVEALVWIYVLLILVYVILSWFQLPYNIWLQRVRGFLDDTVGPYLRFLRRIIPSFGPLDLSPMIGVFGLIALREIVVSVLDSFRPG